MSTSRKRKPRLEHDGEDRHNNPQAAIRYVHAPLAKEGTKNAIWVTDKGPVSLTKFPRDAMDGGT
jgi:hypothetical protein